MKLNKLALGNVLAINHDDDFLEIVIDRGDSLEIIEIPAPRAAYEGLMQLNALAADDSLELAASADFYQLPGVQKEIAMLPIHSTMANAVGYDPDRELLQIEFKNGSVYQYEHVDEYTWEDLISTDSPGRFYNSEIKGNYRSRRLDGC